MIKRFTVRKLILFMSMIGLSGSSMAAAFQLWDQDAVSIGNYHAGLAANADDASTAYYNPAGMRRIKNQQFVVGAAAVLPDLRFRGTVAVNTLPNTAPQSVSVQGGQYKFFPTVFYVAPISEQVAFGLSYTKPFEFNINYGSNTALRYVSVLNTINVVDLTPSFSVAFNDKFSLGVGWDIQRMNGQFQNSVTALGQTSDTLSSTSGSDHAYGCHLGALYQFSENTRVGLSYVSQVAHTFTGASNLIGPLAPGGFQMSQATQVRITLPPTTSISVFHTFNPSWDAMGNLSYTQWAVMNRLVLTNLIGISGGVVNGNLQNILSSGYHNAWNYSVGANYHVNEQLLFRGGLGFDQSPINNNSRSIQLPDSDRIALALGGHYQATETLAVDIGWTHLFSMNTRINNLSQSVGDQTTVTNGSVQANTDIYGLQVKWDIL